MGTHHELALAEMAQSAGEYALDSNCTSKNISEPSFLFLIYSGSKLTWVLSGFLFTEWTLDRWVSSD